MTNRAFRRMFRRALVLLTDGLGTLIAAPIILVVRILRPFVWIRFGYFTSDRIGHFAFDVEIYLTEKKINQDTIINISELQKIKLLKKNHTKIKILGNGELKNKIKLEVDFISKAAKKKVEDVGGSVIVKSK